uniref:Uncharacterized protein n=1 Tax=Cacopsylla melanoneura TaxID=428564 RepID=A0A8D8SJN1_9HEMI
MMMKPEEEVRLRSTKHKMETIMVKTTPLIWMKITPLRWVYKKGIKTLDSPIKNIANPIPILIWQDITKQSTYHLTHRNGLTMKEVVQTILKKRRKTHKHNQSGSQQNPPGMAKHRAIIRVKAIKV